MGFIRDDFDLQVFCHLRCKRVFVRADIDVISVLFGLSDIPKSKTLFCVPSFTWQDVENISGVLVTQLLNLNSRFIFDDFSEKRSQLNFSLEF